MDKKKLNDWLRAAKSGDYAKLEEVKEAIPQDQYEALVNLFNQYSQKPEEELIQELSRIKDSVPNKDEIIQAIKPFLNEEQNRKLENILKIINEQ